MAESRARTAATPTHPSVVGLQRSSGLTMGGDRGDELVDSPGAMPGCRGLPYKRSTPPARAWRGVVAVDAALGQVKASRDPQELLGHR